MSRIPLPTIEATGLLSKGNGKLGKLIYVWSLPASLTCPGRSGLCERLCYALKRRFATGHYLWQVLQNWLIACTPFFVWWMVSAIRASKCKVVRVHVSGDFFSATYVRQWARVALALPGVQFYAYSRSWRLPGIRRALGDLSQLPNFQLWYSWDAETGHPDPTPYERAVRLAYLSENDKDRPGGPADLVFRDAPARGVLMKYMDGVLVCPEENGTGVHIGCSKCGICWEDPVRRPNKRAGGRTRRKRRVESVPGEVGLCGV